LLRGAAPSLGGEVTTWVNVARPDRVVLMKSSRLSRPEAHRRLDKQRHETASKEVARWAPDDQ
jgi:hypothetical protein